MKKVMIMLYLNLILLFYSFPVFTNKYINYQSRYNDIINIYINEEELRKLIEYLKYKHFDIKYYQEYEALRRKFNYTFLESINSFRYPFYYSPYTLPKRALFFETPLVLVNKSFYLEKEFIPSNLDLITNYNLEYTNYEILLKKEVLESLEMMYYDAKEEGIDFVVFSGYRSYSRQEFLYYEVYHDDAISAKPGHSEHQTGYAVDISLKEVGLTNHFENTPTYKWLIDNSYKYGFILRFPKNKTHITKYSFEPWHFRYVGSEVAYFIKSNDLTLEEYIFSFKEI